MNKLTIVSSLIILIILTIDSVFKTFYVINNWNIELLNSLSQTEDIRISPYCPIFKFPEYINLTNFTQSINDESNSCKSSYSSTRYYPYIILDKPSISSNETSINYTVYYCFPNQLNWITNNSKIVEILNFSIIFLTDDILQVKITDYEHQRWEIPHEYPFPHFLQNASSNSTSSLFDININEYPFSFSIIRKSTGQTIFNSASFNFIYSDKYIEISTILPSNNTYGLGERNSENFNLNSKSTYTIFNHDYQPWNEQDGHNLYGSHAVYLQRESKSGLFHTVFLRNSNAMDIVIDQSQVMTFKLTGGIIDFIFFLGDKNPQTSLDMYHEYIGGWSLPPFWSFGYHHSRWGYKNLSEMESILSKFEDNDFPMDAMWNDIDYLYDNSNLRLNNEKFNVKNLTILLSKYNKKWVPIINPGIIAQIQAHNDTGLVLGIDQKIIDKGKEMNVYIKNVDNSDFVGNFWYKDVYYPDFFNPNTSSWWGEALQKINELANFSGLWLSMNEISNFCSGQCPSIFIL